MAEQTLEWFIQLRQYKKELKEESEKSEKLKAYLQQTQSNNAVLFEKRKEFQILQNQASQAKGTSSSMSDTLRSFEDEIRAPKFKDIEKKLLDLNVKFLLTKDLAIEV